MSCSCGFIGKDPFYWVLCTSSVHDEKFWRTTDKSKWRRWYLNTLQSLQSTILISVDWCCCKLVVLGCFSVPPRCSSMHCQSMGISRTMEKKLHPTKAFTFSPFLVTSPMIQWYVCTSKQATSPLYIAVRYWVHFPFKVFFLHCYDGSRCK